MVSCSQPWGSEGVAEASPGPAHTPVLLAPVLAHLEVQPAGRYMDLTFGRGGYARAILERLGPSGQLVVVDQDPEAIAVAKALAAEDSRVVPVYANFGALNGRAEIAAQAFDGVVADLGVSSPQLDEAERGFSFRHDGPLDMRMDPTQGESAADWLARVEAHELITVLRKYGEEPDARRIALAIIRQRENAPITRTAALARLIEETVGGRRGRRIHPATRSFQAIRMAVNAEMQVLEAMLDSAHGWLKPGGRLVVVSFHSLEDRQVKQMLQRGARPKAAHPALPDPTPIWSSIGRELCSEVEAQRNPRARSAVLRWGQAWADAG